MTTDRLDRQLSRLADSQPWPPTPDVADAVAARLTERPDRRRRVPDRAVTGLRIVLVIVIVLAAVGAAVPPVRAALARLLGVAGGERVVRVGGVPPAPGLGLGAETTLARARTQAHMSPVVPGALGRPDHVWFGGDLAGRAISLTYGADTVLTEIPRASVVLAVKMVGPRTRVHHVRVGTAPGVWIDSGPATLVLPGARGPSVRRAALPGAHVLLWDRPGVALRLETREPLPRARVIAASVRPAAATATPRLP